MEARLFIFVVPLGHCEPYFEVARFVRRKSFAVIVMSMMSARMVDTRPTMVTVNFTLALHPSL